MNLHQLAKILYDALEELGNRKIPHSEYLENLPAYKEIIDNTPNKFLKFHLENAIKDEQFELAQYIKETAEKRKFNLI